MGNKKICLHCSQPIIGRADKKFCDAYCRSAYNNQIQREEEISIKKVNSILRKNRSILKHLNPKGRTILERSMLEKLEFNFIFYTHQYHGNKGDIYKFCYDYGYQLLPDNKIQIVVFKSFLDHFNKKYNTSG